MNKETIEFLEKCLDLYSSEYEGTSNFEPETLKKVRADLEAYKARGEVEKRIVDDIYAEFMKPEAIGLFDLGARVCEILSEHKYKKS